MREARRQAQVRLMELEELGFSIGLLAGERTRGPKPKA